MFPKQSFSEANNGGASAARNLDAVREDKKVEVAYEQHEGVEVLALRYMTWTDGLGWCAQKTIELDPAQLDELHLAVTVARRRLASRRADTDQPFAPAKVIHLPTVA